MKILLITAAALLIISLFTGLFAKRSGRNFWRWFGISLVLPGIADIILFFKPRQNEEKPQPAGPVENDEIFDHLFINKGSVDLA